MFFNKRKNLKTKYKISYKAKYLGISSLYETKENEKIIDVLYNYVIQNNLDVKILRDAGFICNPWWSTSDYELGSALLERYLDINEQNFERLFVSIPEPQNIDLLKCIKTSYYSYDFLINVVFPNVDKLVYIKRMVEIYDFEDEKQVLNLLERNILFLNMPYHKEYDYDNLYILVNNLFKDDDFKEFYYCLDYPVLKSLIDADKYGKDDISEILEFCSSFSYSDFDVLCELIPSLVKAGFKKEELFEFIPIILNMKDKNVMVKKIKIFLRSSSKEELFKKIFEISKL